MSIWVLLEIFRNLPYCLEWSLLIYFLFKKLLWCIKYFSEWSSLMSLIEKSVFCSTHLPHSFSVTFFVLHCESGCVGFVCGFCIFPPLKWLSCLWRADCYKDEIDANLCTSSECLFSVLQRTWVRRTAQCFLSTFCWVRRNVVLAYVYLLFSLQTVCNKEKDELLYKCFGTIKRAIGWPL